MARYQTILTLAFLAGLLVLCTGCTTAPVSNVTTPTTPPVENLTACMQDSDCVPAQCCHPTSCINAAYAPNCSLVACTLSCEGPIDCGAGHCGCVNGTCTVIPGPANTTR